MKKFLMILLVALVAVATVFASGSSEQSSGKTKIGIAACHYKNNWNVTNTESMKKTFEDAGYEVVWNEAKNDTATQVANVNDLIAQGVDWVVMKPKEEQGLLPAIEACKKAGVKVILVDRTVAATPGVDFVCGIRTNAFYGGQRVAEWIVANYPNGCNYIEVQGSAGSTTGIERSEGLHSVLDSYGDKYKCLDTQPTDFSRAQGQKVTENMYQAYGKKIDVVVTQSDELAFGVLQALDSVGAKPGQDVKVCTIGDGSSILLDEIINGRVACASECTPYLGDVVLAAIKTVEAGGTPEPNMWANDRFFTIENAAQEQAKATW